MTIDAEYRAGDPQSLQARVVSVDEVPVGLITALPEGPIVDVNETYLAWTGLERSAVIGRTFGELLDVGSRMFYETRHLPVLGLQGEAREISMTVRTATGLMPVLVNTRVVAAENGVPARVHTAVFDATTRNEYERDLLAARRAAEDSEMSLRALQDASVAFAEATTEQELLDSLAETVRGSFDATSAAVLLVDDAGRLYLAAGAHPFLGISDRDRELRIETEGLLTGTNFLIASPDEAEKFPVLAMSMRESRLEAISAMPFQTDGDVLGVVICFFARSQVYEQPALDLKAALCRQAAQVLVRIRLQSQLEFAASHDQLTGLANRALLQQRVESAIDAAVESSHPMAVIFLDLDGFKGINDMLGHSAGDAALQETAGRLRATLRDNDTIGRFGGDEFVVVCESTSEADVAAIVQRIRSSIAVPLLELPGSPRVSASVGVIVFVPGHGDVPTSDELLRRADDAMYRSKSDGKDRVTLVVR